MATTHPAEPVGRPAGASSRDEPVPEPRAFGRYTLRYRLDTGGMASVYLAQARAPVGFRKWVAVKLVQPHLATDPRFLQMFFDEARLAARIDHPNVCTVFDFGEEAGSYFLAMEYLHGESLTEVMRRAWTPLAGGGPPRGVPPALAARVVADAARGLHAAHELRDARGELVGVVHRDVSPQNIFVLYDGVSKVVDFGIARWSDRLVETTSEGELRGKLPYMAPEQVQHGPVDRRTDVFALGVVLWEASTGRRLFKRDNPAATCMAVVADEVPRPSAMVPGYPRALEAVVLRALERRPEARFATADALARALEDYLARAGAPAGPAQLGDFMRALFADRVAARAALLRRELDTTGATELPDDTVREWGGGAHGADGGSDGERSTSDAAAAVPAVSQPRVRSEVAAERTATVSAVGRVGAAQRSAAAPAATTAAAVTATVSHPSAADVVAGAGAPAMAARDAATAPVPPAVTSARRRAWVPWVAMVAVAAAGLMVGMRVTRGGPRPAAPPVVTTVAARSTPVEQAPAPPARVVAPPQAAAAEANSAVAGTNSSGTSAAGATSFRRPREGTGRGAVPRAGGGAGVAASASTSASSSGETRMMRNFDRVE